ncbi:hypothetical protein GQ607_015731 [Colletotrichum asianum]|uniref:Uncharacterized protein n=1 Tax=Colletotrichum asianum TaxID=702518 RepID=A0A8H3VV56_9PEZI|nr:hypothetical protein GQ607_015731 [Colletotrichum asianum]
MYLRMRPWGGHFGWRCLFAERAVRDSAILEQPETLQGLAQLDLGSGTGVSLGADRGGGGCEGGGCPGVRKGGGVLCGVWLK